MAVQHILGNTKTVTGEIKTVSERETATVAVEGEWSVISAISDVSEYVPAGMTVKDRRISGSGGFAKLEIVCVNYGTDTIETAPTRITWRIDMAEVTLPLQCHPEINSARGECEKWLATSPLDRYDDNGDPQWVDSDGNPHAITDERTKKFIRAYNKGIETYLQFYPVVEKISYYKRLPGGTMSENSTTGGTVSKFSDNLGKWNSPGITLNGYGADGYFKSGDSFVQNPDTMWQRTEQWTWTPEGSSSDVAWIYANANDND